MFGIRRFLWDLRFFGGFGVGFWDLGFSHLFFSLYLEEFFEFWVFLEI